MKICSHFVHERGCVLLPLARIRESFMEGTLPLYDYSRAEIWRPPRETLRANSPDRKFRLLQSGR
jgi:hypothetical protein